MCMPVTTARNYIVQDSVNTMKRRTSMEQRMLRRTTVGTSYTPYLESAYTTVTGPRADTPPRNVPVS